MFELPEVVKTSAPEAITKEMLAVKVYQKLRHERVNKYYDGKRRVKAAKAEAAK